MRGQIFLLVFADRTFVSCERVARGGGRLDSVVYIIMLIFTHHDILSLSLSVTLTTSRLMESKQKAY
jgi:hypothetical protein